MSQELPPVVSFTVGTATVAAISIGDVTLPLAPAMGRGAAELTGSDDLTDLARQTLIPLQSVVMVTGDTVVLVDAGLYDVGPDSEYFVPGYRPPPPLVESLRGIGVAPEDVQHVVITHRHWDHFNGTAVDGTPTFPRARHYIGALDWAAIETRLADPASREARSIALVHRAGLLQTVSGDLDIAPGIRIIAAPGETPGHQIVRLESGASVLYALGDLYHHPAEFIRPTWMVSWADPVTTAASRRRLVPAALGEQATLVASHIPSVGMLSGTVDAARWTVRR